MNTWLVGIASALISGASNGLIIYWVKPDISWSVLGLAIVWGASIAVANYLKQFPLPKEEK